MLIRLVTTALALLLATAPLAAGGAGDDHANRVECATLLDPVNNNDTCRAGFTWTDGDHATLTVKLLALGVNDFTLTAYTVDGGDLTPVWSLDQAGFDARAGGGDTLDLTPDDLDGVTGDLVLEMTLDATAGEFGFELDYN